MDSDGPDSITLHCLLYFAHHNMPFNWSDTALRIAKAMKGTKVKIFCFAMFALFLKFGARTRPQHLWPFLILETRLKFLI